MQKRKENLFRDKFHLLYSQEHAEEINWSSTSSSDYEDTSNTKILSNFTNRSRILKRKRKNNEPKNVSHLNITITDTSRKASKVIPPEKSPILSSRVRRKSCSLSPILQTSRQNLKSNFTNSPILVTECTHERSPILGLKYKSPTNSSNVRKKLFCKDSMKKISSVTQINNSNMDVTWIKQEVLSCDTYTKIEADANVKYEHISPKNTKNVDVETNLQNKNDVKIIGQKAKPNFVNFGSDTTSSCSQAISEILTPQNSSKTSDDIDILSCKTQKVPSTESIKLEKENNSDNSLNLDRSSKKIHFKKNGLAYRLNSLLKKQNASCALWEHEKFLAANSSFVIPKGECKIFRIQKVDVKYGCVLLETVDNDDYNHLILINSMYVKDNILNDMVVKIYEPYNILQYSDNWKLILNVYKFECDNYLQNNRIEM